MKTTIKDVAQVAGVSIATVSHVLNRTKYVSPLVENHVIEAIKSTGYDTRGQTINLKLHIEQHSKIAFIVPELDNPVYSKIMKELSKAFSIRKGYLLSIYCSENDAEVEQAIFNKLLFTKQIRGIVFIPCTNDPQNYTKLAASSVPAVILEKQIDIPGVPRIEFDKIDAVRLATDYLVKCGHENIVLALSGLSEAEIKSISFAFGNIMKSHHMAIGSDNVINMDTLSEDNFYNLSFAESTTAAITFGDRAFSRVCHQLTEMNIAIPDEVSIISFTSQIDKVSNTPKPTRILRNYEAMADEIKKIIGADKASFNENNVFMIPVDLEINGSTRVIGRGPFGEKTVRPDVLEISEEEKIILRNSNFDVGISFHYGCDEWARLQELAMREKFNEYGIRILSVTDAHFDYRLQTTQLQGLLMQNPDAIISIPADDEGMSSVYKRISKKTKLIFIQNMPNSISEDEYECWISINEQENGRNIARILKNYAKENGKMDIGLITYGSPFFTLHQRNQYVENALKESSNINIIDKRDFSKEEDVYDICIEMITQNPSIKGLYLSWDRPAIHAIKALKSIGRTDIAIVTSDLDTDIARYLYKEEMVIGLSAQKPYEQGIAAANATAKALLNKTKYKSIGVRPDIVTKENLLKSWGDILKRDPAELISMVERSSKES